MEDAVKLAFKLNRNAIETATPFVVTLHVEEYRRYQLSGCNLPKHDIRVEVVYYNDAGWVKEKCIGFIEDTYSIDEALDALHKLIHDDLKIKR